MRSMSNSEVRKLARDLLVADSEADVVKILTAAGLWDAPDCWRFLGDDENSFTTVGNQQAGSDSALVEKIVNAIDARLMSACLQAGIDPESADAPHTIDEARKRFFSRVDKLELAKGITLAVTGARAHDEAMPCVTICDIGEGQTPSAVPDTFMSIRKTNKLRIKFVQGKFNMGGTGALMFCGKHKLQLLITRRDPDILKKQGLRHPTDSQWAMTVIRREKPPEGPGHVRNPYFKYLAPVGADAKPMRGEVLSFEAEQLDMMPERNSAYVSPMKWGSCIKLYNYDMRGFKGFALRTDGLLSRLEVLLPEVALPVRVHECREGLRGHEGSFATNLMGLRERLEASRGDVLEPGYPTSLTLNVRGQPMLARIYALKADNADRYRADQGVLFMINGQTHGWFPKSFFERAKVKMGQLARSLLVLVDATDFDVDARADLFKNSRDRLSRGDLRRDIEAELEAQIANHPGLRELRERRKREEVAERLSEAKPLENVLKDVIKRSPSLSRLFLLGQRLNPVRPSGGEGTTGGSSGATGQAGVFQPKRHPTFFRFEKLKDGEILRRTGEHGRRWRICFETDVENEYFVRDTDRGRYRVGVKEGKLKGRVLTTSLNLFNGVVNWNVSIPEEDTDPGDVLTLEFTVEDDVIDTPFVNEAAITLTPKSERPGGGGGRRKEHSGGREPGEAGAGSGMGKKGEGTDEPPLGLALPDIKEVSEAGWAERGFDRNSACTVVEEEEDSETERTAYTFYVNVDNIYLQTEMKQNNGDPATAKAKFVFGNVLVGLALIHDARNCDAKDPKGSDDGQDGDTPIARNIETVTRALAPFLIPMVDYLGGLEPSDVSRLAQAGDEE